MTSADFLDSEVFARICPFHLLLGEDATVHRASAAMEKLLPLSPLGRLLTEVFELKDTLADGVLLEIGVKGSKLRLRSQAIRLGAGEGWLLVANPVIRELAELSHTGLSLRDFAAHDSTIDALFLHQSLKTALKESRAWSDALQKKSEAEKKGLMRFPEENPDPILRVSFPGEILYANTASWSLLVAWSRKVGEVLPEPVLDAIRSGGNRTRWEFELDASGRVFSFTGVRILEAGYVNLYGRDITDRRRQETRIREQEERMALTSKLAAIGEVSAGIAHEINNPVAIIHALAGQARESVESGNSDRKWLGDCLARIESTASRIAKIVHGMKSLTRGTANDPFRESPLAEIIEDAVAICAEKFRAKGARLESPTPLPDYRIECSSAQLTQVLVNLLLNALDAMETSAPADRWARVEVARQTGGMTTLRVIDGGPGVPEEARARIFEPFFTTKPQGKGTGLGLGISRSIAQSHGGTLVLRTDQPGACFELTLPERQAVPASS